MPEYKISANAKEDLKRIYVYGLVEFGEEKADIYFLGLYDTFDEIASNPYLYQSIDEIRPGYRRCSYYTDSIYYRISNSTIEIMAILGSQEVGGWF